VKEIVLAVNVQPEALTRELSKFAEEKKITIRYSKEDVPLGTGKH
jgi:ribosomal protein L7Ae-like RNA K-turn-binding protein